MGLGIAVAGLSIAAAILEIKDRPAENLWILIVLLIIFGSFK